MQREYKNVRRTLIPASVSIMEPDSGRTADKIVQCYLLISNCGRDGSIHHDMYRVPLNYREAYLPQILYLQKRSNDRI